MRKHVLLLFTLPLLAVSCNGYPESSPEQQPNVEKPIGKREHYLALMKEKNFSLDTKGKCDNALSDTLHKRNLAYIENQQITDSLIMVDFKFIEACCQEYMGDYLVANDTLKFIYEPVNDEVCSCICWYRYVLTVHKPASPVKYILLEPKRYLTGL